VISSTASSAVPQLTMRPFLPTLAIPCSIAVLTASGINTGNMGMSDSTTQLGTASGRVFSAVPSAPVAMGRVYGEGTTSYGMYGFTGQQQQTENIS
jgi:hypothetical protein